MYLCYLIDTFIPIYKILLIDRKISILSRIDNPSFTKMPI